MATDHRENGPAAYLQCCLPVLASRPSIAVIWNPQLAVQAGKCKRGYDTNEGTLIISQEISLMKQRWPVILIALSARLFAQNVIPAGTVLPVQLNSSLRSDKAKVGAQVTGRIMQDVPLPGRSKIRSGAKMKGHIISATPAASGTQAEISLRFDTLAMGKRRVPMTTTLRALASKMDVEDAQVPTTGADRGTPWAWTTRNLIGNEVAYGQGGPVARGTDIVGEALADGVLVAVRPNRTAGCRGDVAGNTGPQALWVFSSDACGLYDLANLTLVHAGRTAPVGQITLRSNKGNVKLLSGSGMLLRVNGTTP